MNPWGHGKGIWTDTVKIKKFRCGFRSIASQILFMNCNQQFLKPSFVNLSTTNTKWNGFGLAFKDILCDMRINSFSFSVC